MKEFNKVNLKLLRKDIDAVLKVVADKHSIQLTAGNASFQERTATMKLEMAIIDESGKAISKYAEEFKALAEMYEMKPEDLGKTLTVQGRVFKITGLNRKNHAYPILVDEISNGKSFKLAVEQVKHGKIS